ncbi:L-2-hydroxyglutarate dehydrogenase, mitochondrial [Trichoplax sp. H2]|nr:L-2-hydroxyglutarate dehydrogenase, mitochondrial [Trichoplax sp. H2]|eukprot:RDD40088.1 L-2-hydroxyglutarate dehydrogenase, mitochondrial [Trichoplax sp. H2]
MLANKVMPGTRILSSLTQAFRNYTSHADRQYDMVVVGGGIIGLATARELLIRQPTLKLAVLEKESLLAQHQSTHNSGVIHSGVYYVPGSLKAKLCVEGANLMYEYCDKSKVQYKKCGKVIVAVEKNEMTRLKNLYERGLQNGVRDIRLISKEELKVLEPNCEGIAAIYVPHTGIVDYGQVAKSYSEDIRNFGGDIILDYEVTKFDYTESSKSSTEIRPQIVIHAKDKHKENIKSRFVITCCGLYSDRLASKSGCESEPKIVPFRGNYLVLRKNKSNLINGNIYPVPNPDLPFLGVHFTPKINGEVWLGPNAILALSREGYRFTDINPQQLMESISNKGLIKLLCKHWQFGIQETIRNAFLPAQIQQLQRYVPKLQIDDVVRGPAGVRAQALDTDGNLVDDFIFDSPPGNIGQLILHVRNAPSPGATSSLAIAKVIASEINHKFNGKKS